jgi:hypothetical protein
MLWGSLIYVLWMTYSVWPPAPLCCDRINTCSNTIWERHSNQLTGSEVTPVKFKRDRWCAPLIYIIGCSNCDLRLDWLNLLPLYADPRTQAQANLEFNDQRLSRNMPAEYTVITKNSNFCMEWVNLRDILDADQWDSTFSSWSVRIYMKARFVPSESGILDAYRSLNYLGLVELQKSHSLMVNMVGISGESDVSFLRVAL